MTQYAMRNLPSGSQTTFNNARITASSLLDRIIELASGQEQLTTCLAMEMQRKDSKFRLILLEQPVLQYDLLVKAFAQASKGNILLAPDTNLQQQIKDEIALQCYVKDICNMSDAVYHWFVFNITHIVFIFLIMYISLPHIVIEFTTTTNRSHQSYIQFSIKYY